MAKTKTTITVRGIDQKVKESLRVRAAENGRSLEEEIRVILLSSVTERKPAHKCQYSSIRAKIEPLGGIELEIPPRKRDGWRKPPTFD